MLFRMFYVTACGAAGGRGARPVIDDTLVCTQSFSSSSRTNALWGYGASLVRLRRMPPLSDPTPGMFADSGVDWIACIAREQVLQ